MNHVFCSTSHYQMPAFIPQYTKVRIYYSRHLHRTTAEFTHRNPNGQLLTRQENIWIGDPGDAFVMVPVEVGDAFRSAALGLLNGRNLGSAQDRVSLVFYHDKR